MTWFLLAAALMLASRRRGARPRGRVSAGVPPGALATVSAAAGVAMCIALVPWPTSVAVAIVLGPAGAFLARRLSARANKESGAGDETALAFALVATALRAGATLPDALELAAPAADETTAAVLTQVAGLLRLGAAPALAWAPVPAAEPWPSLSFSAQRTGTGGVKLAAAFDRAADEVMARRRAESVARAHRVGVLAVGPLGACFLPAFVCLGIAPVIIAVAGGVGAQLR